jgi:type VI secretion system protein ImpG
VFSTCYDLEYCPLSVTNLNFTFDDTGGGCLKIELQCEEEYDSSHLCIQSIPIHINAEPAKAKLLFHVLTQNVYEFTINHDGLVCFTGGQKCIKAHMFNSQFKDWDRHLGFLSDYFLFPERLLFISFSGFEKFKIDASLNYEICIKFKKLPFNEFDVKLDELLLNCVPAINCYKYECEPLMLCHKKSRYKLLINKESRQSYQLQRVFSCVGIDNHSLKTIDYNNFYDLKHTANEMSSYKVQSNTSQHTHVDYDISFVTQDYNEQSISITALVNNAYYPRLYVKLKSLYLDDKNLNHQYSATNITRPTAYVLPKPDKLDDLLCSVRLDISYLADVMQLKSLLYLYDVNSQHTHQIESLNSITYKLENMLKKGYLIKVLKVSLKIDDSSFPSLSELYFFCMLLNHLYTVIAPMNTQVRMHFILTKSNLTWFL